MHLKRCGRKGGKSHWKLVESYRSPQGPRHRTISYLGALDAIELEQVAGSKVRPRKPSLLEPQQEPVSESRPQWAEVNVKGVYLERSREFGGPWLGLQVLRHLGLDTFLSEVLPEGKEDVPWSVMAQILVLCRLCHPSSELRIAEHLYEQSGLEDLLGITADKINDDRLYRALDQLLAHKEELEKYLQQRMGELFELDYDLLLYDSTSTFFEGLANGNPQAQRGYSRDQRPDCKQVCIALVVTRCGMPLCYEVFAGNRADVTTTEDIVEKVEARYGKANRIWVMDRGMVSDAKVAFLRDGGRRYIVGSAKSYLKRFEADLVSEEGWQALHNGVEVKLCPAPDGSEEKFIVCRSEARQTKERAMQERFEERFEERLQRGLESIAKSCAVRKHQAAVVNRRLGRLLAANSRAAGLFQVKVRDCEPGNAKAGVELTWSKHEEKRAWSQLSHGCYLLRTNIIDWTSQELWLAYIQLTEAEAAFRIHKQDLSLRPVWHQKEDRVQAHILVCFLSYVLWKSLGQMCRIAGLGDEPRRVLEEIKQIRLADVVMPTKSGIILRKRCVTKPSPEQAILLHRLKLRLPTNLETKIM